MVDRLKVFFVFGNMNLEFQRLFRQIKELDKCNKYEIIVQSGYSRVRDVGFKNSTFYPFLDKDNFIANIRSCDFIISHAGIGVITDSLEYNKVPIVMPRRYCFNEHIDDHQVDFVERYKKEGIFRLIDDDVSIVEFLENILPTERPKRQYIHNLSLLRIEILKYIKTQLTL